MELYAEDGKQLEESCSTLVLVLFFFYLLWISFPFFFFQNLFLDFNFFFPNQIKAGVVDRERGPAGG